MEKHGIVYWGGIPGVGKTTISSLLSSELNNCEYISSGEIKRPESRRRYRIGLSLLDQEKSLDINRWFFSSLYSNNKISNGGNILQIVDTHYTYPLGESSFVNLCPEDCVRGIDLFVLLEADAQTVFDRRIARGRDRDSVNLEFIKKELYEEKKEAVRLSDKYGVPLEIFRNEESVSDAVNYFRNYFTRF